MGVLRPQLTSVNMVNAPVIARERGVEMAEVKHERAGDYHSMIRLTVTTEKYTRAVTGTLFGGQFTPIAGRPNDRHDVGRRDVVADF